VSRHGDEPRPQTWAFWAGDDGRFRRSGGGTVELHYEDGSLVLTRGDVALLSVPLPGPPSDVFFDGQAQLRGLALLRAHGLPPAPTLNPIVVRNERPAGLEWREPAVAGMRLSKLEDGRVELASEPGSQRGLVSAAICPAGIYEYMVEVEDPQPGTGVFFGDEAGEPLCRIGFMRDKTSSRTCCLALSGRVTNLEDRPFNFDRQSVPYCGPRQQFRVVLGAGVARVWTSGDGLRWSVIPEWVIRGGGQCRRIGLCCFPARKRRSIKLRSVVIRRLDALSALAPGEIDNRSTLPPETEDAQRWLQQVDAGCPAGVAPRPWRRACIVRMLASCSSVNLGQPLLHQLLDDLSGEPLAWETRVRVLEQAGLMMDVSDNNNVLRQAATYEELGNLLLQTDPQSAFTRIVHLALDLPAWSLNSNKLDAFPPELLRHELLSAVYRQRWADVDGLCRRLQYWNPGRRYWSNPPSYAAAVGYLLDWAQAEAAWRLQSHRDSAKPPPSSVGHPLLERLNKEGYTIAAEFQAALASRSYREACQIIGEMGNLPSVGLVPDPADPALLTSLNVMAQSAIRDVPPLRAMMEEHAHELGQLRVRQAIAAGQAGAVDAICTQFPGTHAAAEAYLWLGERALSAGRIAEAIAALQAGLASAGPEQRPAIEVRLRLAGALGGLDLGPPARAAVQLGPRQMPAEAFESWTTSIRKGRQSTGTASSSLGATASPGALLAPGPYTCRPWGRFVVAGERRGERPAWLQQSAFDWIGYQIRTLQCAQMLIVAHPTRLTAFDLHGGRPIWSYEPQVEPSRMLWPSAPMQPIAVGSRVVIRRPLETGVGLTALDSANGQVLWSSNPKGEEVFSDPLWIEPELFALTAARAGREELALQLTRFDPASGTATAQYPLLELRNVWSGTIPTQAIPCHAIALGDQILVNVGGCVLVCDVTGRVRWLRRQTYLPWPKDNHYAASVRAVSPLDPPILFQNRVYAMQPGGWSLECADFRTGHLIWQQVLPELRRLWGVAAGRLLVATGEQLMALDPASGKTLWSRPTGPQSVPVLAGPLGAVLLIESDPQPGLPASRSKLVWLDGTTGRPVHTTALNLPSDQAAQWAPLVLAAGHWWGLLATEPNGLSREIVELISGQ
jgi:outer membrane protein assembly factor BamB